MTLDIRVSAPHTTLVDTRTARIDGQADLRVRGTFDQPQIDGQVDILGGEYQFNGNRIFVRDGSTIDFRQGDRLEPVFDILAETRVRVTGQTFTVTIGLRGTFDGLNVSLSSEPLLAGGRHRDAALRRHARLGSRRAARAGRRRKSCSSACSRRPARCS